MVTGILIVLHGLVIILRALPGIEFGDNKALKYLTEDNGVAEVSFKEYLGNISDTSVIKNCDHSKTFHRWFS